MSSQQNTSTVSVTNHSKDLDLSSAPEDIAKVLRENNTSEQSLNHLIVDCQNCNELTDAFVEGMSEFIEESTSLTKLTVLLRRAAHLTDDSLLLLGSSISTLEALQQLHLSFENCEGMTREGIQNLSTGIAAAENILDLSLRFRYCEWMSDECISEICQKAIKSKGRKLLRLELDCEYCFELTDESAKSIGDSLVYCSQLNNIILQIGSTNISDKGIAIIGESTFPAAEANNNPQFKKSFQINMQGCENITDEGVNSLANSIQKSYSSLKSLSIAIGSNNAITNASIENLISAMKHIRQSSLYLCSLPLLTAEIIQDQYLFLDPESDQNKNESSSNLDQITLSISKCFGIKPDELFQNIQKLIQISKDNETEVKDETPSTNVIVLDLTDQPLSPNSSAQLLESEKVKVIQSVTKQSESSQVITQKQPQIEPLNKISYKEEVQGGIIQIQNSQQITFVQFSNNSKNESESGSISIIQTKIISSYYPPSKAECLDIKLCSNNMQLQLNGIEKCFKQKILSKEQYTSINIEEQKSQSDDQSEHSDLRSEDNTVSLESLLLKSFSETKLYESISIELLGKHTFSICNMTLSAISAVKAKHYKIKVANCQNISDEGFKSLLAGMASAETIHVNLYDCTNLSDASILLIKSIICAGSNNHIEKYQNYQSLRNLEILLSKSESISDTSLVELRDSIRKIEECQIHLNIRLVECTKPSLKALVNLDKAIKRYAEKQQIN